MLTVGEAVMTVDDREAFLSGGGQMGALIRVHDWSASVIGRPSTWPQSLRTAIRVMLNTGHPMYIWWGPDLVCFYNDAYRQSIGPEMHPGSLGRPAREVWAEIWHIIGPEIEQVMSGGGATWHENALVPITRNGRRENVYWTYSYGPIDDETAATGVGGVLVVCSETTAQVAAALEAEEERARLAELFKQAPTFMAMLRGSDHVIELANPDYMRLVGHREVLGKTVAEALPDAVEQGYVELLDQVYRSGEPYIGSGAKYAVQVTPGGPVDERYVDFVYQPIKDATGVVNGIFVQGVDVTNQREALRKLGESEQQLRLAIEAAEVGLWDVDMLTDTLYWPPRVKAMFGISDDVPVSMADYYNGLHPDDFDRTSAAFAAALDPSRRAVYDVEYRTIGKEDRIVRWVAAKGRGLFDGDRCVRVIGTAIDITARKTAEENLRDLNETLERRIAAGLAEKKILVDIIESTDAFVQVADLNFRFLAINRASAAEFERLFGVRPKVGDNMLDLLDDRPDHRNAVEAVWSRALAGEEFNFIGEFGDPLLDRRHYEIKFNALRDQQGNLIGAFQFVYDVTNRMRDQARLAKVETQIRQAQKIDAIGLLTGGVAHDFNNLLMVISGGLSLLEQTDDVERRARVIHGMRQAAERGASLTGQLLRFSRRQPLKPEAIDLREQIGGMHELLDRALRGDVHVQTELSDDLWAAEADPAELELVILNLSVNARDAMPNGGVITIRAENMPDVREDELSGDFVCLTVSDTGVGMSADVMAHIFEPFFTTKEIGEGTGLGLPQVYGFAQQSGGSVKVESVVGQGTTVRLLLPRTDRSPRAHSAPLVLTGGDLPLSTLSVLVVEDDNEVAALVEDMLRELGCIITRVAGAEAALGALADARKVDLVFSDVMMPGPLNGVELAQEIRRRRPDLPVLLTSGYAEAAFRKAGAENIGVLVKPYRLPALQAAIMDTLAGRLPIAGL